MTLPALLDDALRSEESGFSVRLALPWIRSLPIASLSALTLSVDGKPVEPLTVRLGERRTAPNRLSDEDGWWFVQDRVVLCCEEDLKPGVHNVSVDFRLIIPNLMMGPDGPLHLPFHFERYLTVDSVAGPGSVARNVA